jgi:uncharacterized damage-inducible protein DinB
MPKFDARDLLLEVLDRGFDHASWHGPNLRSSLRGVTIKEASFRPGKNRHSIWEHVVHAAYWKYTVRRRIAGEKRGSFPLKGSNWFQRPLGNGSLGLWEADLLLLDQTHATLREVVAKVPASRLRSPIRGGAVTYAKLIMGIAAHDVYHAGQINLLKRLARSK